jgi:TPR repeat protein
MGKKLVPSLQTRNAIERLVQKGIIQGEAAGKWRERQAELQALDKEWRGIMYNAHQGDKEAMRRVGYAYRDGVNGFKADRHKAIYWWERASLQGCVMSTTCLGISHVLGKGYPMDTTRGLIALTRAATLGSEHGAICVANHLATGTGLTRAHEDAARWWYNYSKTCSVKDTTEDWKKRRDTWLNTHGE